MQSNENDNQESLISEQQLKEDRADQRRERYTPHFDTCVNIKLFPIDETLDDSLENLCIFLNTLRDPVTIYPAINGYMSTHFTSRNTRCSFITCLCQGDKTRETWNTYAISLLASSIAYQMLQYPRGTWVYDNAKLTYKSTFDYDVVWRE